MKMHPAFAFTVAAILGAVALTSTASRGNYASSTAAKPAAASSAKPVPLGNPSTARWTATTNEAAAAEANKKVLASGKKVTVTGEVVDVSCYLQLGKRGEGHVACGTKCIEHGEPVGLVDANGKLYLLFAEEHHPRRDGTVDLRKSLVPLLAKTVTATGMETESKGVHALYLQAAEIDSMTSRMGGH